LYDAMQTETFEEQETRAVSATLEARRCSRNGFDERKGTLPYHCCLNEEE
jgi:hypothetical protein